MILPRRSDGAISNHIIFSSLLKKSTLERLANHPRATRALRYACEHLPEVVKLNRVAASVGMTSPAFSRYFAEEIGLEFSGALKILRIERALRELERHDCAIERLAYCSGYRSACSFTRAFKAVLGQTPTDYRRRLLC